MGAIISECKRYRYALYRDVGNKPLVFCMLNPSTADAETDDRTIAKCRKYAKGFGYDGIIVVNLYAYRSTDPKIMLAASDPVGPDNDKHIFELCRGRDVICAWGANALHERINQVITILNQAAANTFCLSLTNKGQPGHPLYLKNDAPMLHYASRLN